MFVVAVAAAALSLTACEKRDANVTTDTARTTETNTTVDTTSGSSGMSAESAPAPAEAPAADTSSSTSTKAVPSADKTSSSSTKAVPPADTTSSTTKSVPPADTTQAQPLPSTDETASSVSSATAGAMESAENKMDSAASKMDSTAADLKKQVKDQNEKTAKFYEPQSTTPDKTGSTSMTGQDRSHAQATQRKGTFVDPTVEPKADLDRAASQSVQAMNLNAYPYSRRDQFKSAMDSRLEMIEGRIDAFKSSSAAQQNKNMITSLEQKHDVAEDKLKEADKVDQARWEGYKIEFRDQIAELERSIQSLPTARK